MSEYDQKAVSLDQIATHLQSIALSLENIEASLNLLIEGREEKEGGEE